MSALTKLYLEIAITMGLVFTICMSLVLDVSIGMFIFIALSYGGTVSALLVTRHKRKLQEKGVVKLTTETLSVIQTQQVTSNMNQKQFLRRIKTSPVLDKRYVRHKNNIITVKTKMSWDSFGEIITIKSKEFSLNKYSYNITSRPKFDFTLLDYGKNLQNVLDIKAMILNQ